MGKNFRNIEGCFLALEKQNLIKLTEFVDFLNSFRLMVGQVAVFPRHWAHINENFVYSVIANIHNALFMFNEL